MLPADLIIDITVEFQPLGRRVRTSAGVSLLQAAREAGIRLLSVCGGAGTCDTCRVRVVRGDVSAATGLERRALGADALAAGERLACQAIARGNLVVDVPLESIATDQRLQLEWMGDRTPGSVRPRSEVPIADSARELRRGSPKLGEGGRGPRSDAPRTGLGLAVDIGTTKIAAYLVDLDSGHTLAADGTPNPQIAYGEDVISRIAYADRTSDGAARLHAIVIGSLNELVARLCTAAARSPVDVVEAVVVGNTVMHHLALGLPIASLGRAPYTAAVTGAVTAPAVDVGFRIGEGARVYLPPNLSGYVGADHVAMLVAVGAISWLDSPDGRTRLAIDIGTNTEVSLIAGDRAFSCSCASGPAFEGAHISCGMRAAEGAVERVRIVDGTVHCQTIGGVPPIGVCGSGALDAVAELVSHRAVTRHGAFAVPHPLVVACSRGHVFTLAPAAATGHNRDLTLTRRDVSEIQLAKAAIRTGIDVLLERAGVGEDDLDEVIVAGAFGTYVDLASARRVGMLPNRPARAFSQVGNAAGAGARAMLLSPTHRASAERLASRLEHVDLTTHPRFADVFAARLGFSFDTLPGENRACDRH